MVLASAAGLGAVVVLLRARLSLLFTHDDEVHAQTTPIPEIKWIVQTTPIPEISASRT